MKSVDRRTLLRLALLTLPLGFSSGCAGQHEEKRRRLIATRRDLHSAKVVGRLWLRAQHPQPNNETLVQLLFVGELRSPEQLRDQLQAQHQRDLEEGRLTEVNGWVISETEAHLYALIART